METLLTESMISRFSSSGYFRNCGKFRQDGTQLVLLEYHALNALRWPRPVVARDRQSSAAVRLAASSLPESAPVPASSSPWARSAPCRDNRAPVIRPRPVERVPAKASRLRRGAPIRPAGAAAWRRCRARASATPESVTPQTDLWCRPECSPAPGGQISEPLHFPDRPHQSNGSAERENQSGLSADLRGCNPLPARPRRPAPEAQKCQQFQPCDAASGCGPRDAAAQAIPDPG